MRVFKPFMKILKRRLFSLLVGIKMLPRKNPDGTNVYVVQNNTNVRVSENILKLYK